MLVEQIVARHPDLEVSMAVGSLQSYISRQPVICKNPGYPGTPRGRNDKGMRSPYVGGIGIRLSRFEIFKQDFIRVSGGSFRGPGRMMEQPENIRLRMFHHFLSESCFQTGRSYHRHGITFTENNEIVSGIPPVLQKAYERCPQ
ncbi:hypothetical protein ABGM91_12230 [Akkermansia muciniphila]|uniref:hypothetical protein n=1 Tax=Akkermansia muciniphila TaxID=239935 RepID=UPI0033BD3925